MSSFVREMRENLDQVIRMHKLNLELLEQLDVVCGWLIKTNIQIPNEDTFKSLIRKAKLLLNEIYSPPKMQHQKQTPEDTTEHARPFWKECVLFPVLLCRVCSSCFLIFMRHRTYWLFPKFRSHNIPAQFPDARASVMVVAGAIALTLVL